MKNYSLLTCLFIVITFIVSYAQSSDPQWFIKDGKKKDCSNSSATTYSNWNGTNIATLSNVMQADANRVGTRNDIFVIYSDGSYFNSRLLDNPIWNTDRVPTPSKINLELRGSNSIDYLYLTNNYESDDPDACVGNTPSTNSLVTIQKNLPRSVSSNILATNHDIVKSRDVTLIVNKDYVLENCPNASNMINICFDTLINHENERISALNNLELQSSRVFGGNSYSMNMGQRPIGTDLCIRNIPLSSGIGYLNFKVPDVIQRNLKEGYELLFYIEGCPESELAESIRDSHDPNFVKVECVSEVNNKKFAKYTISTFNETENVVNALKIGFMPPIGWNGRLPTNITSTVDVSGNPLTHLTPTMNGGIITFPFNGYLGGNETATITFCLEMDSTFDLVNGNLQMTNPIVDYDGTKYPIYNFVDIYTYEGSALQTNVRPHTIENNVGPRPMSGYSDCGCGVLNNCTLVVLGHCITWPILLPIILVFLFIVVRFFRN